MSINLFNYFNELPCTTIVAFVKHQKEMSERMKNVYETIKGLTKAEIRRMSGEEILNINNTLLNKVAHIFVLDDFAGSCYDHLLSKKQAKFNIFGVPLLENLNETNVTNHWRIYNNSFQNMIVCTSNLKSDEKTKIENLVKLMNGRFTNEFSSEVTQLITNSTKTVKYYDATRLDIPIYHTNWAHMVWKKSSSAVVRADSPFFDFLKLPILFDLKITTTGTSKEQRNEISELIEENGGKFEEALKSNGTDILLMDKNDLDNSKYKLASKYKIPVLNVSWIHESIKAGYAIAYDDFRFKRQKSQDCSSSSVSIDSIESTINTSVEESHPKSDEGQKIEEIPKSNCILIDKSNEKFISTCTVEQVTKLGPIFDGYAFYFYNFPTEHYFKFGKFISACGGIKITELDQSVTHILCFDKENLESFQKKTIEKEFHGSMIDYKWLVECFKQGKLLAESDYIITIDTLSSKKIVPPSPLSRKAIQSLNVSITNINDESKKENTKDGVKKELKRANSSKMLNFSNSENSDKNQKHDAAKATGKKRSHEGDLDSHDEMNKRRKMNECNKSSFQVL